MVKTIPYRTVPSEVFQMDSFNGVYIGSDIEVVVTDACTLAFVREGVQLTAYMLLTTDKFHCVGLCRATTVDKGAAGGGIKFDYAMRMRNDRLFASDHDAAGELLKHTMMMTPESDRFVFRFKDGAEYPAYRDEILGPEYFDIETPYASADNAGLCLTNWHMGVIRMGHTARDGKKYIFGAEINTRKHMYLFKISESAVNCRAARYAACNRGGVFDRNFIIGSFFPGGVFENEQDEANMRADNLEAMRPLEYDEASFDPGGCVQIGTSAYWSIHSIRNDEIALNSGGGGFYYWRRPAVKG